MPETYLPPDPEASPARIGLRAALVLVPLLALAIYAGQHVLNRGPTEPGELLEGTVHSVRALESEAGTTTYLRVSLENGTEVQVKSRPGYPVGVGGAVWLRELKSADGAVFSYRLERTE